jgi:hypothetical protein
MGKRRDPERKLIDLAKSEGSEFVHRAYTREFEAACLQIKPDATTEDFHDFWEKGLEVSAPIRDAQDTLIPSTPSESPTPREFPPTNDSVAVEENRLLFDKYERESISDLQPWTTPREPELSAEQIKRRQEVLAAFADSRLATTEQKVAHVLQHFPESRDSDVALCIRYWQIFQADVIESCKPFDLNVLYDLDRSETITRVRRLIQNELRLFRGLADTHRAREAMQAELHQYIAAHRDSLPEIRFYLDETGNEADKAYCGIGGVCVSNWKQFDKHHAALELWRSKQGAESIRFSDTGETKLERAVSLLDRLRTRRAGLLFVGYSMASRGRTSEILYSLFIQLVVDALKRLRDSGCLAENRSVQVIKEADPGFDALHLQTMNKHLEDAVTLEFPERVRVLPIQAVPKGRTVLLECADLIAGGMQRRALYKGRNIKDRLAEAVVNVTGFEDHSDRGALFRFFA